MQWIIMIISPSILCIVVYNVQFCLMHCSWEPMVIHLGWRNCYHRSPFHVWEFNSGRITWLRIGTQTQTFSRIYTFFLQCQSQPSSHGYSWHWVNFKIDFLKNKSAYNRDEYLEELLSWFWLERVFFWFVFLEFLDIKDYSFYEFGGFLFVFPRLALQVSLYFHFSLHGSVFFFFSSFLCIFKSYGRKMWVQL